MLIDEPSDAAKCGCKVPILVEATRILIDCITMKKQFVRDFSRCREEKDLEAFVKKPSLKANIKL